MIDRPLQIFIAVLPVTSAGLYLLGISYVQGYLGAYGIDTSLYPLASDLALFSGLLALISVSFPAVVYALAALCLFVFAVLISASLASSSRVQVLTLWLVTRIQRWRPKQPQTPASTALLDRSFLVYAYATGVVAVLLALLLMAALSAKRGKEQAENERKEFTAGNGWHVTAVGDQLALPTPSRLVICGDRWCSFWTGEEAVTVRRESIQRIHSVQPSKASSATSDASESSSTATQ